MRKIAIWFVAVVVAVITIAVVIRLGNGKKYSYKENGEESYVLKYNDEIYNVVPRDLLEYEAKYKEILYKYGIDMDIEKEHIGEKVVTLGKSSLYKVKNKDTKDVLIMKDINNELVYAFLEKTKNNSSILK